MGMFLWAQEVAVAAATVPHVVLHQVDDMIRLVNHRGQQEMESILRQSRKLSSEAWGLMDPYLEERDQV